MINIKQLRKHYGNNYVLRGIDLTIKGRGCSSLGLEWWWQKHAASLY